MGCFWQKPFKAIGKLLRKFPIIGQIIQIAAVAICTAGTFGACSPFAAAFLASAVTTGLASGKLGLALKAGLISAVSAYASSTLGDLTQGLSLANVAGHAAVGCASSAASGGECGSGALSGAVGALTAPLTKGIGFEVGLVVTSTVGGLASVAGGGKFGNGAVTAAFGYMFNYAVHEGQQAQQSQDGVKTAFCPVCAVVAADQLAVGLGVIAGGLYDLLGGAGLIILSDCKLKVVGWRRASQ